MTQRLYYHDSFLCTFDAEVRSVIEAPRPALVLDRTAFYPTSGGQIHDTGWIASAETTNIAENREGRLRVSEVADAENGDVIHYLEAAVKDVRPGSRVQGHIDAERRRDHMQQHSAQHVLSAAFVRLFNMPTVSFHMAADYCSIDLDTPSLSKNQIEFAERLANEIVQESRPVAIRFVSLDEASNLGLRKLPPVGREKLRLIDIQDFDLTPCGGTHVNLTGQVGAILLRKTEKVRQGYRVEFVAGQRAVLTARNDFQVLTEAAGLFSAGLYEVPQHLRKSLDAIRSLRKHSEDLQQQVAGSLAAAMLSAGGELVRSAKLVIRTFSDHDINFLKLLAQKLTRQSDPVVALLGTTVAQPALIFAQSPGQPHDMGSLLKNVAARFGGRGGGTKDLAQGGLSNAESVSEALSIARAQLQT